MPLILFLFFLNLGMLSALSLGYFCQGYCHIKSSKENILELQKCFLNKSDLIDWNRFFEDLKATNNLSSTVKTNNKACFHQFFV